MKFSQLNFIGSNCSEPAIQSNSHMRKPGPSHALFFLAPARYTQGPGEVEGARALVSITISSSPFPASRQRESPKLRHLISAQHIAGKSPFSRSRELLLHLNLKHESPDRAGWRYEGTRKVVIRLESGESSLSRDLSIIHEKFLHWKSLHL